MLELERQRACGLRVYPQRLSARPEEGPSKYESKPSRLGFYGGEVGFAQNLSNISDQDP